MQPRKRQFVFLWLGAASLLVPATLWLSPEENLTLAASDGGSKVEVSGAPPGSSSPGKFPTQNAGLILERSSPSPSKDKIDAASSQTKDRDNGFISWLRSMIQSRKPRSAEVLAALTSDMSA